MAVVSIIALLISLCSLLIAFDAWLRSARPVVAAAVKTRTGGNQAILYDLVVVNSGAMPARNVRLVADAATLASALGSDATTENKQRWLACFDTVIPVLLNNEKTTCSFGMTKAGETGFWKYGVTIDLDLIYDGRWRKYRERQQLRIADSDSFTGYHWQ